MPNPHPTTSRQAAVTALLLALALLPGALPAAVVVELFTSQGCSSCPPADRLLTRLGSDPELAKQVIPLAFHVDYWNWIGWRDPFSDAAWSQRQRVYGRGLRPGEGVFTPQAVIGGRRQCNGADVRCIQRAVQELSAQPAGEVTLAFAPAAAGSLQVGVWARPPAGGGKLDVMLAVFEKSLETAVGRGENASKTLRNDFVVRRLQRAFQLEGGEARRGTVAVPLDPGWNRGNVGIAVFLQDPRTRQIHAAAAAPAPAS